MYSCFLSYEPLECSPLALQIRDLLIANGYSVYLNSSTDEENLRFEEERKSALKEAKNFICILSSKAAENDTCQLEIEDAIRLKKRIIPIIFQNKQHNTFSYGRHADTVQKFVSITVSENEAGYNLEECIGKLKMLLSENEQYNRSHTQLLNQAEQWRKKPTDKTTLIAGHVLQQGQNWLKRYALDTELIVPVKDVQCQFVMYSAWVCQQYVSDYCVIGGSEKSLTLEGLKNSFARHSEIIVGTEDRVPGIAVSELPSYHIASASVILYVESSTVAKDKTIQAQLELANSFGKPIIKLTKKKNTEKKESGYLATFLIESNGLNELVPTIVGRVEEQKADSQQYRNLLTQAWRWKYAKKNVVLLLDAEKLAIELEWLKEVEEEVGLPLLLEEYIAASEEHNNVKQYTIYCIGCDTTRDFSERLMRNLKQHGRSVWEADITTPKGKLRDVLAKGMEACENVLVVLNPTITMGPEQRALIGHALRLKKRMIPLAIGKLPMSTTLPPNFDMSKALVFRTETGDKAYFRDFGKLICALDIQAVYQKTHTKWLIKALAWKEENMPKYLLLLGDECVEAKQWLDGSLVQQTKPEAPELVQDFISQSHKAWKISKRQRSSFTWARRLMMVAGIVGFLLAWHWGYTIQEAKDKAQNESEKANKLFLKANANNLIALAGQFEKKNPTIALRLAEQAEALQKSEQVTRALYSIYSNNSFYRTLGQHKGSINAMAFYADKRTVVTGGNDQLVYLWKLRMDGKLSEVQQLKGHSKAVTAVDVTEKGKFIATGSADKTVRLWNLDGEIVNVLSGHDATINSLCFSPDGKLLVTAGDDNSVILWSVQGDMLKIHPGHSAPVESAIFTNGEMIVSAGKDKKLIFWNIKTDELTVVPTFGYVVKGMAYSGNLSEVSLACSDGKVRRYNLFGQFLADYKVGNVGVNSVVYSSNFKEVLTTDVNGSIVLWTARGQRLRTYLGHEASVNRAMFTDVPSQVISISDDHKLNRWYTPSNVRVKEYDFKENVHGLKIGQVSVDVWTTTGKYTRSATGVINKTMKPLVLPLNTGAGLFAQWNDWTVTDNLPSLKGNERLSAVLTQNKQVIYGLESGEVRVYNGEKSTSYQIALSSKITALAYDSISQQLLAGAENQGVTRWLSGKLDTTVRGHKGKISCLTISPDGKYFASAGTDGTIRIYDKNAMLLRVLVGHESEIRQLKFSAKGELLASSSTDGKVKVWETAGYEIQSLDFNAAASEFVFLVDRGLSILLETGVLYSTRIPVSLEEFRKSDHFEELSIAQMLDLKIKFYEQLYTEEELAAGALFFYDKANAQEDGTLELRNLIYADSLFVKLHDLSDNPEYYAQHLQVLLSLRRFENSEKTSDKMFDELVESLIKSSDENKLRNAARYLEECALQNKPFAELNYLGVELIYRRLYLEHATPDYLVGRLKADLMLHEGKQKLLASKKKELLKLFLQLNKKQVEKAAELIFTESETISKKWLRREFLLVAEQLYAALLEEDTEGGYFVNLTEVLLHLQEVDSSDLDLVNKIKNISVQLSALRKQPIIQDAANRFLVKAERESSVNRRKIYLVNANTLYGKLFHSEPSAEVYIKQRKVLLGLRRTFPENIEYADLITENLTYFRKITEKQELLTVLDYLDREISFATHKAEKVQLLLLAYDLYKVILAKKETTVLFVRFEKVIVQLQELRSGPVGVDSELAKVMTILGSLTDSEVLTDCIALYAKWQEEIENKTTQLVYIHKQEQLYTRLFDKEKELTNLKRAWEMSEKWLLLEYSKAKEFQQLLEMYAIDLSALDRKKWKAFR